MSDNNKSPEVHKDPAVSPSTEASPAAETTTTATTTTTTTKKSPEKTSAPSTPPLGSTKPAFNLAAKPFEPKPTTAPADNGNNSNKNNNSNRHNNNQQHSSSKQPLPYPSAGAPQGFSFPPPGMLGGAGAGAGGPYAFMPPMGMMQMPPHGTAPGMVLPGQQQYQNQQSSSSSSSSPGSNPQSTIPLHLAATMSAAANAASQNAPPIGVVNPQFGNVSAAALLQAAMSLQLAAHQQQTQPQQQQQQFQQQQPGGGGGIGLRTATAVGAAPSAQLPSFFPAPAGGGSGTPPSSKTPSSSTPQQQHHQGAGGMMMTPTGMPASMTPQMAAAVLAAVQHQQAKGNMPGGPVTASQSQSSGGGGGAGGGGLAPQAVIPTVKVNVGNAALNALKEPPKFACVVTLGLPRVGTTTASRDVVKTLEEDKLRWCFFSGGDHLKHDASAGGEKQSPWEASKNIFDALSSEIDTRIAGQSGDKPIRGLVIDKHFRGVEDLYYLTGLLRTKHVALHGIVALDCDEEALIARLRGRGELASSDVENFRERLRFRRVLLTQLKEIGKSLGIWHTVDADQSLEDITKKLRGVVLGCSAKPPVKGEILVPSMYHDGAATFVDSVDTYHRVMSQLMSLARTPYRKYPGTIPKPLPRHVVADSRFNFKDNYYVRRKSDGNKYILFYDGNGLFLVPKHMRCVLLLPDGAWIGVPLKQVSKFILEGELTRLSKERTREKFLVHDALCWCERDSTTNILGRAPWKERHELLTTRLCNEASAFFSRDNVIIVHQLSVPFSKAAQLFEPCDYPTEGICLQPIQPPQRWDAVWLWRSPELVTIDFRLGRVISGEALSNLATPAAGAGRSSSLAAAAAAASDSSPPSSMMMMMGGREGSTISASGDLNNNTGAADAMLPPIPVVPPSPSKPGGRTYVLEVFDVEKARYVEFRGGTETVNIKGGSRSGILPGAIIVCAIDPQVLAERKLLPSTAAPATGGNSPLQQGAAEAVAAAAAAAGGSTAAASSASAASALKSPTPSLNPAQLATPLGASSLVSPLSHWVFLKVRNDVFTSTLKSQAEDIINDCLISRTEICHFLGVDTGSKPAGGAATGAAASASSSASANTTTAGPSSSSATAAPKHHHPTGGIVIPHQPGVGVGVGVGAPPLTPEQLAALRAGGAPSSGNTTSYVHALGMVRNLPPMTAAQQQQLMAAQMANAQKHQQQQQQQQSRNKSPPQPTPQVPAPKSTSSAAAASTANATSSDNKSQQQQQQNRSNNSRQQQHQQQSHNKGAGNNATTANQQQRGGRNTQQNNNKNQQQQQQKSAETTAKDGGETQSTHKGGGNQQHKAGDVNKQRNTNNSSNKPQQQGRNSTNKAAAPAATTASKENVATDKTSTATPAPAAAAQQGKRAPSVGSAGGSSAGGNGDDKGNKPRAKKPTRRGTRRRSTNTGGGDGKPSSAGETAAPSAPAAAPPAAAVVSA